MGAFGRKAAVRPMSAMGRKRTKAVSVCNGWKADIHLMPELEGTAASEHSGVLWRGGGTSFSQLFA